MRKGKRSFYIFGGALILLMAVVFSVACKNEIQECNESEGGGMIKTPLPKSAL